MEGERCFLSLLPSLPRQGKKEWSKYLHNNDVNDSTRLAAAAFAAAADADGHDDDDHVRLLLLLVEEYYYY